MAGISREDDKSKVHKHELLLSGANVIKLTFKEDTTGCCVVPGEEAATANQKKCSKSRRSQLRQKQRGPTSGRVAGGNAIS